MAQIPKTSVALLNAIASDPQSLRWYEFYNLYQPVMQAFLAAKFPSVESDDVIQNVMVAIMAKLPDYSYDPDENGYFRNYLLGILKNKAFEHLRKRKRDAEMLEGYKEDPNGAGKSDNYKQQEDEEREWRHKAYEVAIRMLLADSKIQERNREVFRRIALQGESPVSVASAYGITRNCVDQIKNRMMEKLREIVERLIKDE